jgi:hypothetical protein
MFYQLNHNSRSNTHLRHFIDTKDRFELSLSGSKPDVLTLGRLGNVLKIIKVKNEKTLLRCSIHLSYGGFFKNLSLQ